MYYRRANEMRSLFNGLFMGDTRLMRTDIEELEDGYSIAIEAPGIYKEQIAIDFEEDTLTVSIKAGEALGKSYVRRERYTASGSRSFYLKDIDDSSFKARMENGILYINVNKRKPVANNNKLNISIE